MVPVFAVGRMPPAPTEGHERERSGLWRRWATARWCATMAAANEVSCAASVRSDDRPLSPLGMKSFGTSVNTNGEAERGEEAGDDGPQVAQVRVSARVRIPPASGQRSARVAENATAPPGRRVSDSGCTASASASARRSQTGSRRRW